MPHNPLSVLHKRTLNDSKEERKRRHQEGDERYIFVGDQGMEINQLSAKNQDGDGESNGPENVGQWPKTK